MSAGWKLNKVKPVFLRIKDGISRVEIEDCVFRVVSVLRIGEKPLKHLVFDLKRRNMGVRPSFLTELSGRKVRDEDLTPLWFPVNYIRTCVVRGWGCVQNSRFF